MILFMKTPLVARPVFALHLWNRSAHKRFQKNRLEVKEVQTRILGQHLKLARETAAGAHLQLNRIESWNDLQKLPISHYSDWAQWIEKERVCPDSHLLSRSPIERFQPTSGSTDIRKWIPYTKQFLGELDQASGVWLHDIGKNYPGVLKGRHYWSLSWLPDDLRAVTTNDDLDLWPWWKRKLMSSIMVAPGSIANLPTNEQARFATAVMLAGSRDLSLISVWSPTFLLRILEDLTLWREEISVVLESGQWSSPGFKNLNAPKARGQSSILREWKGVVTQDFLRELWPNLALVSAWDSSTSTGFAQKIQKMFSYCDFQGKGLWATEGVVTIPVNYKNVLAFESHVYEFRCLDSGRVFTPWSLEAGQRVQPILTTGNGIWRYELPDEMLVSEVDRGLPVLEFRGRIGSVDLVGEKMDKVWASQVLSELSQKFKLRGLTFLAEKSEARGGYTLLAEGSDEDSNAAGVWVEERLSDQMHYKLARQMGQLREARVQVSDNALDLYSKIAQKSVGVDGAQKIEAVTFVDRGGQ
jgi:hypothetical protein